MKDERGGFILPPSDDWNELELLERLEHFYL
jgi:hypothetical protein